MKIGYDNDAVLDQVHYCEQHKDLLSKSERLFIARMGDMADRNIMLSTDQLELLGNCSFRITLLSLLPSLDSA